eukprot:COSAG06_NODE_3093_length_5868_cov_3.851101_1_plen_126_part_10
MRAFDQNLAPQPPFSSFIGGSLPALNVRSGNDAARLPMAPIAFALSMTIPVVGPVYGPTKLIVNSSAYRSASCAAFPATGVPSKKSAAAAGAAASVRLVITVVAPTSMNSPCSPISSTSFGIPGHF